MFSLSSSIAPTKRILIIAIVVGVIAGFGSVLFFEGLKWGTAFFMGYLLHYAFPQEGQSVAAISQWSEPDSLVLLLPVMIFGSLLYRDSCHPVCTGSRRRWHRCSVQGIPQRWPDTETDSCLKGNHFNSHHRDRGECGKGRPCCPDRGRFWVPCCRYARPLPRERRIALTTGIGAGIGTIFKAPLGGAVLAAEVLYTRDFESEAIIPAFLASVIGYAIFGLFEGYEPIFALGPLCVDRLSRSPSSSCWVSCVRRSGSSYISVFYGSRDGFAAMFKRHNLPQYLKPVFGALILGILVIALSPYLPGGRNARSCQPGIRLRL